MDDKEFNKMMDKREEVKIQKEKMKRFEDWEKNQAKDPLKSLPKLPEFDIPTPPKFQPQEPMATQSNQKLPKSNVSVQILPNLNLRYKKEDYVPIVTTAIMVMKIRKILMYACYGGAFLPFLILAFSTFNFTMGAGIVMLMVIGYVFLLMQNKKEMQYITQQYKI